MKYEIKQVCIGGVVADTKSNHCHVDFAGTKPLTTSSLIQVTRNISHDVYIYMQVQSLATKLQIGAHEKYNRIDAATNVTNETKSTFLRCFSFHGLLNKLADILFKPFLVHYAILVEE